MYSAYVYRTAETECVESIVTACCFFGKVIVFKRRALCTFYSSLNVRPSRFRRRHQADFTGLTLDRPPRIFLSFLAYLICRDLAIKFYFLSHKGKTRSNAVCIFIWSLFVPSCFFPPFFPLFISAVAKYLRGAAENLAPSCGTVVPREMQSRLLSIEKFGVFPCTIHFSNCTQPRRIQ